MLSIQLIKKRDGFVLSIVLWIVAALLFGIATVASFTKDTQELTQEIDNKLKTELIASDILEILKFYIITADFDNISFKNSMFHNFSYKLPDQIIVDNRWYNISNEIKFRVIDASALLNVGTISVSEIAKSLTTSSELALRSELENSLLDWIDKDNIVSLNGAENATYQLQKRVSYQIRNANALQSVEELQLVNGYDSLSDFNISKFYYGRGTTINLALVDAKRFSDTLNIDILTASSLLERRGDNMSEFLLKTSNLKTFYDDYMGFYLSKELQIEIEVTKSKARTSLYTLIDFREFQKQLYTVIKYNIY